MFGDFLCSIDPLMLQLIFLIYHFDIFKVLTLDELQKKDSPFASHNLKYSKKASINFEILITRDS